MTTCTKCGKNVAEGVKFCPECGAQTVTVEAAAPVENNSEFAQKVKNLNNTADTTAEFEAKDIEENKYISVLSYCGPLVLIPMFAKKESKFARFHANQGLILLILDIAYGIIQAILGAILRAVFPWKWTYGYLGGRGPVYGFLTTVISLLWIVVAVLAIIGIINAINGKAKELPIIGKFRIFK